MVRPSPWQLVFPLEMTISRFFRTVRSRPQLSTTAFNMLTSSWMRSRRRISSSNRLPTTQLLHPIETIFVVVAGLLLGKSSCVSTYQEAKDIGCTSALSVLTLVHEVFKIFLKAKWRLHKVTLETVLGESLTNGRRQRRLPPSELQ